VGGLFAAVDGALVAVHSERVGLCSSATGCDESGCNENFDQSVHGSSPEVGWFSFLAGGGVWVVPPASDENLDEAFPNINTKRIVS
jgi:hypothetical protein